MSNSRKFGVIRDTVFAGASIAAARYAYKKSKSVGDSDYIQSKNISTGTNTSEPERTSKDTEFTSARFKI